MSTIRNAILGVASLLLINKTVTIIAFASSQKRILGYEYHVIFAGWIVYQLLLGYGIIRYCYFFGRRGVPVYDRLTLRMRRHLHLSLFIILVDVKSLLLLALDITIFVVYPYNGDLFWYLSLVSVAALMVAKVVIGRMLWVKYGRFLSAEPE